MSYLNRSPRPLADLVECAYCSRESDPCYEVPSVDDDAAWTEIGRAHV